MINRISKVINIGSYNNFDASTNDTVDFKTFNFIFGENSSGKTILSKLVSLYSKAEDDKIKDDIKKNLFKDNAELVIKIDNSNKLIKVDTMNYQKNIYVFNSLFVTNYLHDGTNAIAKKFNVSDEIETELITPILTELKTKKEELQSKIGKNDSEGLKKEIKELNDSISDIDRRIREEFNEKNPILRIRLSTSAAKFKQPSRNEDEINSQIRKIIEEYRITQNDSLSADIEIIRNNKNQIIGIDFDLIFESLNKVVEAEAKEYILALIDKAKRDGLSNTDRWYSNGLSLLKKADDNICPLCNSDIKGTIGKLITDYQAYFNKEKEVLEVNLQRYQMSISKAIETIRKSDNVNLFRMLDKYKGITTGQGDVSPYVAKEELLTKLNALENAIKRKLTDNKEIYVHDSEIGGMLEAYKSHSIRLNTLIDKVIAELSDDKEAKTFEDQIKNLFYEKFSRLVIDKTELDDPIKELSQKNEKLTKQNKQLEVIEGKINVEIGNMKVESKYVNEYLKAMNINQFNVSIDNQIKIEYISGGNSISLKHSLSEGEKTTLAFAYFLSKIKSEVKTTDKARTVIYIDDPISSIDEDRLFYTAKVIENTFKDFQQLIISSHSYKFLKILIMFIKRDNKNNKLKAFSIKNNNGSMIEELSDEFAGFSTMYYTKFHEILSYLNDGIPYNKAIHIIPNDIRIVLESFFSFKFTFIKSDNKFVTPGLRRIIKKLKLMKEETPEIFVGLNDVNDITLENWDDKLDYLLVHFSDMFSHGNAGAIDSQSPRITESELQRIANMTIDIIKFFDAIHFELAQTNISEIC